MHMCLGQYGYAVEKSKFDATQLAEIKRECTVTTEVLPAFKDFQKPKKYMIFYQDKQFLYLPRFYALEKFGKPQYMALPKGNPISVKCKWGPLKHQEEAIAKLTQIFDQKKKLGDGGVLSLPCGYGKTFCAIYTACQLGLKTLIIVPTENLLDQFTEAILTFAPDAKVGRLQGKTIDIQDKDFVVAMLHSVSQRDYPRAIFDTFGLTIFDECHHLSSEVFCKSMMKIRTRFTLGLSATPRRSDGLSNVFFSFLGPLLHKEKRSGSNQIIVKKIKISSSHPEYETLYLQNGTKNTSGMITALAHCQERNDLLIECIKRLVLMNMRVLAISSRKQHLFKLGEMLDGLKLVKPNGKPVTHGFYFGFTADSRDKLKKEGEVYNKKAHKSMLAESAKCDIVLGIDALAKEGLDIPDRNALVWLTPPGMEIEQPVGRILRKFHSVNPIVIDPVDNVGNFSKHSSERDKWFNEEDYVLQPLGVELEGRSELWMNDLFALLNQNNVQIIKNLVEPVKKKKKAAVQKEPSMDVCLI